MKAHVGEHPKAALQLEASLPDWCALKWQHALVCLTFVLMFLFFSYLPIPVATTWHDAWTGNQIATHGLYDSDPSLPLSEGIRHHVDGWLGRVCIHQARVLGGMELLSFLFAAVQTMTIALWSWLLFRVSGRWWASLTAVALAAMSGWLLTGLTTETFGQLCFVILISCLVSSRKNEESRSNIRWSEASLTRGVMVLLMMVLWANLSGSFLIGWGVIALLTVSRMFQVVTDPHEPGWQADAELRARLLLFECVILVAILNPIGWRIWQAALWWPDQPLWQSLGGWQPLTLASWPGVVLSLLLAGWLAASRSATRLDPWQWLVPVAGVALVACCVPCLLWVGPLVLLVTFSMLPRVDADGVDREHSVASSEQPALRFAFTLVCGLLIWVGFTISPYSSFVLGGQGRSEQQLLGSHDPVVAVNYLLGSSANTDDGELLWCPNYWSDRLQSSGKIVPVFANLDLHSLPTKTRSDYRTIYLGQTSWQKLLDQYSVDRLLIDKQHQPQLLRKLRKDLAGWTIVHEDDQALVLRRRTAS